MADPSIGPGPINVATGQRYYRTFSRETILGDPDIAPPNTIKPAARKEAPVKKEPKASLKTPPVKREPKPKQETKQTPKVKKEEKTQQETPSIKYPKLGLINGLYDLSCPTISSEWSNLSYIPTDFTLTLSGTAIWGSYDLGMFTGILHLPTRPWEASGEQFPFLWRGRDRGEGEMSFGEGCQGEIAFLGDGVVEGWIGVYGDCHF